MTSSHLKINLLGPVEITYEKKPLKVGRRIERAILYFLAAENRPVSRTALIDLLWSDEDEIDHRGALRTALSRLRNHLPNEAFLVTELDQVWLDAEQCRVDVIHFENYFDSLKNHLRAYHEHSALPGQIVDQIKEALALWRADAILQGDDLSFYPSIENWRRNLNRRLSHQRITLMEKLANHYHVTGHLDLALDYFSKLGRMDLLNTGYHLSVLDILTDMQRFQEAVDYCDALEIAYEKAFNAPLPDPILEQYQYSKIQLKANEQKQTSDWPIPLTMQLQMVGRDKELKQLQKAFYHGGIVVIKGELGSGKTRLVQELFQSFQPQPKLFFAPSQEMETSMPLSPIIHGLRHHVSREIWETIDCVWANKMSLLLPELVEFREDCVTGQYSGTPTAKQQLFDAIHHVLQNLSRNNQKILFFLDDAQWADKETMEAISYFGQRGLFEDSALLIIAARKEEPNQDLNEMVDRFHRTQDILTIHLNRLNPHELSALAQQAFGNPTSSSFLDKLYQQTSGNPFLALEILRYLLEFPGEINDFSLNAQLPLPENVHAIIRERLNRLDDTARQILLCAAVIGNDFSLDLLSSVAPQSMAVDKSNLDQLIEYGFISSSGQNGNPTKALRFAHEIMRTVALKEASTFQVQAIHQRVAANLAVMPQARELAAVIANHYVACGEINKAFQWYLEAAQHAWSLGAKQDTHQLFQQAESLKLNSPPNQFTTLDHFELYRQWSRFAYEADWIDLLEEIGFKLQYLGEQEHDPLLLGFSQLSLANACFLRLNMDTGLTLINKAIDYLQHTENNQAIMEAKLRKGAFLWWILEYDESIRVCQDVLQLGEPMETEDKQITSSLFFARHTISYSYYAKGNANKALNCATESYDRYFHKLSAFNRMRTLNVLANTNRLAANFEESKRFAIQGLEIANNLENTFVTQTLLITLSKIKTIQGNLDETFALANRALSLGEEQNYTHTIISANCVLGTIYRHLQNYNLALQHYRVAQLRGGYSNDSLYSIQNDLELVRTISWMGHINEARDLAKHALEVTNRHQMMHLHTMALLSLALCDILEGNFSIAETTILQAEQIAQDCGLVFEHTWCTVGKARIALSRRQFDTAEEEIKAILEVSDQHNMAWLKLRGLNFCFQLLKATQKPSLLFCRSEYQALTQRLADHTRSDALSKSFKLAEQSWREGHAYP